MRITKRAFQLVLFCYCCAFPLYAVAQALPRIGGESLSGRKVVLPDDARGKVSVLILGFSRASKGPTSDWARKLLGDFAAKECEIYQLPVLENVPRLIRGMVISSIKKGVPENRRDRFVPILQGEAELQKFVNYSEPDDAYLIVLDRSGQVAQQMHGALNDPAYSSLRAELEKLLNAQ